MVNLIRIPSFAYCVLHTVILFLTASWSGRMVDCWNYAASALAPKSTLTTLSLAFNLVCPLITENSSRTRNPDIPITTSKPWHPLVYWCEQMAPLRNLLVSLSRHDTVSTLHFCSCHYKSLPLVLAARRQNRGIPLLLNFSMSALTV